jgi:hypothetical protein
LGGKDRFGRFGRFGSLESAAGVEKDFCRGGLRIGREYGIIYAVKTKKTNENLANETVAKVPRRIYG